MIDLDHRPALEPGDTVINPHPYSHPHLSLLPGGGRPAGRHPDEATLTDLALAARAGDGAARDRLYLALRPNIDRMVDGCARLARAADCPRRDGRPWDREDLRQEAFLVFCDLIRDWAGQDAFTPYLFAFFPWRLRNAWRRLRPERPRRTALGRGEQRLGCDPSFAAEEARVLLEALAGRLSGDERELLLAHIRDGESLAKIARRLDLSPRQMHRRWRWLRLRLRRELVSSSDQGRIIPFRGEPRE